MTNEPLNETTFEVRYRDREIFRGEERPEGPPDYTTLAAAYESGRIRYAPELYGMLYELGLNKSGKVLDLACGTGFASEPIAAAGAHISGLDVCPGMLKFAEARIRNGTFVHGMAEQLAFPSDTFDAVVCAQAFHWFEREKAMDEAVRVTKRGGVVAIWWKHLMMDDPVKMIRDEVGRSFGGAVQDGGLVGGFIDFYRAPFSDHILRVVPWRMAASLDQFMGYERSRYKVHETLGAAADRYFEAVRKALQEKFGSANPWIPLSYLHFLYVGKKS